MAEHEKGPEPPSEIPALFPLLQKRCVYYSGIGLRQSEGSEPSSLKKLRPYVRATNAMLLGAMPFVVEAELWTTVAVSAVFVMYMLVRRWL